jgi:hypothetical protein
MLRVARWAAVYFAIVFGVGFALGPIRVLWLEPRIGVRTAGLVLLADLVVGTAPRRLSVVEVFTARDPASGSVYHALVALTAFAPWILGRLSR